MTELKPCPVCDGEAQQTQLGTVAWCPRGCLPAMYVRQWQSIKRDLPQQSSASPAEAPEGWLTREQVHSAIWDLLPGLSKDSPEAAHLFTLERMALAALSAPAPKVEGWLTEDEINVLNDDLQHLAANSLDLCERIFKLSNMALSAIRQTGAAK